MPSWSASSLVLCHSPSLMTVKNFSMLKCNRACVIGVEVF
jgi:hypothetical protein